MYLPGDATSFFYCGRLFGVSRILLVPEIGLDELEDGFAQSLDLCMLGYGATRRLPNTAITQEVTAVMSIQDRSVC
jgi:hypothetical protein